MDSRKVMSDMMRFLTAVFFCLLRLAAVGVFDTARRRQGYALRAAPAGRVDVVALDDGPRRKFFTDQC